MDITDTISGWFHPKDQTEDWLDRLLLFMVKLCVMLLIIIFILYAVGVL